MKKWLSCLFVVILFVGLLAGCGKEEKQSLGYKKDVITFWIAENFEGEGKLWESIVEKYNQDNPDVEVELSIKPWDKTPMNVALQSKRPPDVAFDWFSPPTDAYEDLKVDLLEYITPEEKDDFGPQVIARMLSPKGKMNKWPWYLYRAEWMLANGDLLKQVGANPELIQEQGWNWDEFLSTCQKLAKVGVYGYGDAQSPNTVNILLNGLVGPSISDKDPYEFNWIGAETAGILQRYRNLIFKEKVMPKEVLGIDIFGLHEKFSRKEFGIIRSYTAWVPNLEKEGNISKVYILPYQDQGGLEFIPYLGVGGWAVFKQNPSPGEEHLKNVVKFVKYISQPIDGEFIPMHWGGLPPGGNLRQKYIQGIKNVDPNLKFTLKVMETGKIARALPTAATKINEIVNTYISEAMSGQITAQRAVEKWTAEVSRLLK